MRCSRETRINLLWGAVRTAACMRSAPLPWLRVFLHTLHLFFLLYLHQFLSWSDCCLLKLLFRSALWKTIFVCPILHFYYHIVVASVTWKDEILFIKCTKTSKKRPPNDVCWSTFIPISEIMKGWRTQFVIRQRTDGPSLQYLNTSYKIIRLFQDKEAKGYITIYKAQF